MMLWNNKEKKETDSGKDSTKAAKNKKKISGKKFLMMYKTKIKNG